MTSMLNAWSMYREVMTSTKKKILKKPNYPLAIQRLKEIALQFIDMELYEQAALCYGELAAIHKKTGDLIAERETLLRCADLLMTTFRYHKKMRSKVKCQVTSQIAECYTKVYKLAEEGGYVLTAGMSCARAASIMHECEDYHLVVAFAKNAVRLLEGEFNGTLKAYNMLIQGYLCLEEWEDLLISVDSLWVVTMKSRPDSYLGRTTLRDCEVLTLLVLQVAQIRPAGRHRVLLELYNLSPTCGFEKSPGRSREKEVSSLTDEDFASFNRLLLLIRSTRAEISTVEIMMSDECSFMSELARNLCRAVYEKYGQK